MYFLSPAPAADIPLGRYNRDWPLVHVSIFERIRPPVQPQQPPNPGKNFRWESHGRFHMEVAFEEIRLFRQETRGIS